VFETSKEKKNLMKNCVKGLNHVLYKNDGLNWFKVYKKH